MTVEPGFGGQSFMSKVLPKIAEARQAILARGLDVAIEVDGGIEPHTAAIAAGEGARTFVAGSAVFGSNDPAKAIETIRRSVLSELV